MRKLEKPVVWSVAIWLNSIVAVTTRNATIIFWISILQFIIIIFIFRIKEKRIAEETTSEVTVYYSSRDILAYIDSYNMVARLEKFLRSSGYEGTLACVVGKTFEVDNQNKHVIFTILINGTDIVQAIYARETEEYRFIF